MNRWPVRRLGELAAPEKGAITDGPFGSNLTSAHYTDDGPLVVRLQNIGDGVFNRAPAHISNEHFRALQKHEVLPGDLLVASLGEGLPRACITPSDLGPAIVKADCIRVRLARDIDARWVSYAMQRPEARRWAVDRLHGVGRPRLGLKLIRDIPIPTPPLEEQLRIVDLLEDHLSHVEAGDFGLASVTRRSDTLRWAAAGRWLFQPGAPVAEMQLTDALTEYVGGVWGHAPGTSEVEVDVVRVTELKPWGVIDPSTAARRSVPRSHLHRRALQEGDLVLEKSGGGTTTPIGRVGILPSLVGDAVCSNFMQLMRPDPTRVLPRYLHLLLNAMQATGRTEHLQRASTNLRNIKTSEYARLQIAVPALEVQRAIIDQVEVVWSALGDLSLTAAVAAQRSRALRRTLFAAAFSGRLTGRSSDLDLAEELINA